MDTYDLKTVARTTSLLLWRDWIFRLLFLLVLVIMGGYLSYVYGGKVGIDDVYQVMFSSFVPYMGMYLHSMLQMIPLLIVPGILLRRGRKIESLQVVYSRPAGNVDYMLGICLGVRQLSEKT